MDIDQQIRRCEERILRLEDDRRNAFGDQEKMDASLDEQYRQVTILKIRKMMGY